MDGVFDRIVVVDWSANSTPKSGADSIWIAVIDAADGLRSVSNPCTRHLALAELRDAVGACSGRVLVGFDFPMGPPRGVVELAALADSGDGRAWDAMWVHLAAEITDDSRNRNNRFAVATAFNQRVGGLYYWGAPPSRTSGWLTSKKPARWYERGATAGVSEFRIVERRLREQRFRPFSWWQLLGAGSVGSQVMTGLAVVHRLRVASDIAGRCLVWPFETGVRDPLHDLASNAVLIAEVWPSMLPAAVIDFVDHRVKDARQVIALAACFADVDRAGRLSEWFTPDLDADTEAAVLEEEGWVVGVTGDGRALGTTLHAVPNKHTRSLRTGHRRLGVDLQGPGDRGSASEPGVDGERPTKEGAAGRSPGAARSLRTGHRRLGVDLQGPGDRGSASEPGVDGERPTKEGAAGRSPGAARSLRLGGGPGAAGS